MISFICNDYGQDRHDIALKALPEKGICYTNLATLPKEKPEALEFETINTLSEMVALLDIEEASFLIDLSYETLNDFYMAQLEFFMMLADFIHGEDCQIVIVGIPAQEDFLEGMVEVSDGEWDERDDEIKTTNTIDYDLWPIMYFDIAVEKCKEAVIHGNVKGFLKAMDKSLDARLTTEQAAEKAGNKEISSKDLGPFLLPIKDRVKRVQKVLEEVVDVPDEEVDEAEEDSIVPEPPKKKRIVKRPIVRKEKEAADAE